MQATLSLPEPVLDLRDLLNTYLEPERVAVILRAYETGARAHEGQTRKTGEPYIFHPVAVAKILANMRMDSVSVAAAILHDTIEDTPLTKDEIEQNFGAEIAELVDGVTKLDKMKFRTRSEADAESFRKLMLAMSRDLRVIFIKLADRMHNMRTLGSMASVSRRRIARETLDIYAPIADRLGMNSMKSELEDLGFANLFPWRHRTIAEHVSSVTVDRRQVIENIRKSLKKRMSETGIPCRIIGREKTPYSIYKKMRSKDLSFTEVMDVYGFRIITQSEPHCYMAMGACHALYQPKPGRFKDYIALPKANGYQSLHTILNSPYGLPVEIQIRTEEMDVMAEKGAAAHWHYKMGSATGTAEVRAREWLMQLVDVQRHTGDSMEFLDGAKSDLFPDEIFVFTPKGKIIDLRRNATALDFAYAIHTDVGNHTRSVLVDNVEVPLSTQLANGQTVKVITDASAHPRPDWLGFVATARARTAIRQYIKSLEQEATVALGLRMLEIALNERGSSVEQVDTGRLEKFLAENHFKRQEDLFTDLALGNMLANIVAAKLDPGSGAVAEKLQQSEALTIVGEEGSALDFGICCHPVPGDRVMGYMSAGKGMVVHRIRCHNIRELRKHPDRCVDVVWAPITKTMFKVSLRILTRNVPGVLANISTSIGEAGSNIERVEQPEANPETATLLFTLSVRDRDHMARVMRRLRRNRNVIRVSRTTS